MIISKMIEVPVGLWGDTPTDEDRLITKLAAEFISEVPIDAVSVTEDELIEYVSKRIPYCTHGFHNVNNILVFWARGNTFDSSKHCFDVWLLCILKDGDKNK